MTVYESMNAIPKNQFIEFCRALYWKAYKDGEKMVDDEPWIVNRMIDSDFNEVIEILWEDTQR